MARKSTESVQTFGQQLDALRVRAGLSYNALARAAGLSPIAVSRLARGEQGQTRAPNWDTVQRLAIALGVSTEALRTMKTIPEIFPE